MWPGTSHALNDKYAREHELGKYTHEYEMEKLLKAAYQFRACIFHAPIMRLCFNVGDTTFGAHAPEVLFCVEQSLLQ